MSTRKFKNSHTEHVALYKHAFRQYASFYRLHKAIGNVVQLVLCKKTNYKDKNMQRGVK